MINLLTPIEKKKILKEYRLRLGVTTLVGILVLELVSFVSLIPSYAAISSSTTQLAVDLAHRKSVALPGGDETQKQLDIIKQEIGLLKEGSSVLDAPASSVLENILKVKPKGIDVSLFAFSRTGIDTLVQVSGISGTREDMLSFKRALESDVHFTHVSYADNSFMTKKTDINFSLTLKLK